MSDTPWSHFSRKELTCQCGCGRMEMDPNFMTHLETLRIAYGKPIRLSSAYRCPAHNATTSHTGQTGPHTTGTAVDVLIYGHDAYMLLTLALKYGFKGIGISQRGSHESRFIHLDMLDNGPNAPRPWVWGY